MERNLSHIPAINDCNLAEAEVYHLNQRLHDLIHVIQQLTVAHDLETIMAAVRTGARQLTGADGATFVLRDGDQCYYADEDAISPLWKGGRFPMSACISGWVMLNQQSVVIEDIYADPRIPADAYRPTFVKSLAMVPIRTRDPVGAIGNYWATHHVPSSEDLKLLQTLADAAAVALENLHLYEEQEQRIQERTAQLQKALDFEALLKRITDKVRDSLDEQQILATVVQALAEGLSSKRCSTTLYHLEPATASLCYQYQHDRLTVERGAAVPIAPGSELYSQLSQGEPLQFCPWPQAEPDPEANSLILVGLIVDDCSVLGEIRLSRTAAKPFTEREVRLVQQVANQCEIALRQARLHRAIQAQVTELAQLNQLKDDFLSTVSHELRTPMTNIRMAVQMLTAILGVGNLESPSVPQTDVLLSQASFAKAVRYLQILSHEGQRETKLINDLLSLTQREAAVPDTVQDVFLQSWVPQIAEPFQEKIQQQEQRLQIHIPTQVPPFRTNLTVLERILTELLQNACKYTPAGETISIAATTRESEGAEGELNNQTSTLASSLSPIWLTVSNSGVKIPDRDLASIFDKFYRIPNRDPWKNAGTGVGLALVKQLVEQLSGSIEVASRDNLVCFTVKLAPLP